MEIGLQGVAECTLLRGRGVEERLGTGEASKLDCLGKRAGREGRPEEEERLKGLGRGVVFGGFLEK